jgi:acetylornithine deacetylase/succinyl-diaminopimelate desuccinylase-like protein
MLPDEDVDAFYQKLAAVIDDPQVTVVPEAVYRPESAPSPIDNDMFQSLESVAKRMYPEATVIPNMSTGATDMAQVRATGVPSYGIGPIRSIEEMNSGNGAHGDNERVSEEAMKQLVQFLWYTIIDIAASE